MLVYAYYHVLCGIWKNFNLFVSCSLPLISENGKNLHYWCHTYTHNVKSYVCVCTSSEGFINCSGSSISKIAMLFRYKSRNQNMVLCKHLRMHKVKSDVCFNEWFLKKQYSCRWFFSKKENIRKFNLVCIKLVLYMDNKIPGVLL